MDYLVWLREWGFPLSALVFVLATGHKGYWVWGREVKDLRERLYRAHRQADEWRNLALSGTNIAADATKFLVGNGGGR